MKTFHLLPVLAHAQDDTSTLLSLKMHTSLESGVDHLLDAVGSRNVTQMASLLQNLVEESISDGLGDLDHDVQNALNLIKKELLGDIRASLKEAHCFSQVNLHSKILCFQDCEDEKRVGAEACGQKCDGHVHRQCRAELFGLYKGHIEACRGLDTMVEEMFKPCPSTHWCLQLPHTTWNCQGPCANTIKNLDMHTSNEMGQWMMKIASDFEAKYSQWLVG
jgi:hypothetical protein